MRHQPLRATPALSSLRRLLPSPLLMRLAWTAGALIVLAWTAPAQLQFDELAGGYLPAHADDTAAIVLRDIDGDGDPDLIVGNGGRNRLYTNDGTGRFIDVTTAQLPFHGEETRALTLGDVDGDGDPDLVLGTESNRDRLYLNDGSGTFTDVSATRMPQSSTSTRGAAMGDLDGDGDLDLVLGIYRGQDRLLLNDGLLRFVDASLGRMPPRFDRTLAVALGDVDGDGDLDLVCGNGDFGLPEPDRLYLNDGNATFTDATAGRLPTLFDITNAVALGDVDGDGDVDLVAGNNREQNRLLLNDGSGTFSDATTGRLPLDNDSTRAVALGDVDGDGDSDLIVGNEDGQQNRLYLNDGTGTFTDATTTHLPAAADSTAVIASADVDADGSLDLVFGNTPGHNQLYLNRGTGMFSSVSAGHMPPNGGGASDIAIGDVDGDDDLDLVLGGYAQSRLYLNDSTGVFADATTTRIPADNENTLAAALGDVDRDGDLDLMLGNGVRFPPIPPTGGQNRLYFNDGSGTFADVTALRMPLVSRDTFDLALGDVDGDGDLDVVFANVFSSFPSPVPGQNQLYLNNGTGVFSDATTTRMPVDNDSTRAVAMRDVDGDGDPDLVFGNYGQQNRLYLNDGFGAFVDASAGRMPSDSDYTVAVALEDVDGDGDADLVIGNTRQQNRVYRNDGGTFVDVTAASLPVSPGSTTSLALADVDGDGDVDLVEANTLPLLGQDRLYLNDGSGTFTEVAAARFPSRDEHTSAVALGDVDADGDQDIVLAMDHNRLYLNLLRQLDVPLPVRLGMPYQLDVYARYGPPRPSDVAAVMLSGGASRIPLPPFGTFGLDPAQLLWLPSFAIPRPAGVGSVSVPVPNIPGLVGLTIYAQAFLVQDPAGTYLTNWTADEVLR